VTLKGAISRRASLARVVLGAVLLLLTACSGGTPEASRAFCLAADRYDNEIVRTQRRGEIDAERQLELYEELARTAPRSVADDARLVVDALRQVEDDPSIKDSVEVREAFDNVNRLANQACGVYESNGI
jgi:hypothetical protein